MVAPAIALIAASGLTAAEISIDGEIIAAGILFIAGCYVAAKKGEKVKEIENSTSNREKYELCCCGRLGPSGKPCNHVIMKKSRKEAEEAAKHYKNANGAKLDAHNKTDKYPHYHPTRDGVKIPGIHFQFPDGS